MFISYVLLNCLFYSIESHTPKNDSDVLITYSGHAEAINEPINVLSQNSMDTSDYIKLSQPQSYMTTVNTAPDDIVFIPNEKEIQRNDQVNEKNVMNIGDYMVNKNVDDVLEGKGINFDTEAPKDIFFISGKNNENVAKSEIKEKERDNHSGTRRSGKEKNKPILMDCNNLDCNNTVNSTCGGKIEHKKLRYRLFLNDCYFRKVNCNFKYAENRYTKVPNVHCQNIGVHYSVRPYVYKSERVVAVEKKNIDLNARKSYSSRRSQNKDINGRFCSHRCPISCPDDYDPECAVSTTGRRKVFSNHCKLDYDSCTYSVIWQRRPLAECVGGKKADLQQNRGFIGWMQRVGIVDNRGRLVLQ
ncbi:uncharacterized protein LOC131845310 [Achroia grisella]|uniref:uncharacterized protein LOC131845310 n=1 Tax=Achroia grisella TaxID=688607 RepID=UPI0027D30B6C|nr:uncharacterized protein LOC131845310 [Achroia grisella]